MDNTDRGWKNALGVKIVLKQSLCYTLPRIIAISGKFGSGKDTLIELIKDYIDDYDPGNVYRELKFAGALKEATAAMTGTTVEENYSAVGKEKVIPELDMSLGRFQQILGTVARVHIHPQIWVIPVIRQCLEDEYRICFISDCRFVNEADAIQKAGGVVIRLNRSENLISEQSKAGRDPLHVSETALDDYPHFDFVYQNDGTLNALRTAVFKFLGIDRG